MSSYQPPTSHPLPESLALSQESLTSSSSASVSSHDFSHTSSDQLAHDFFSDPRYTRWVGEGPIRHEASAKFRQANSPDIRLHYVSEVRAATVAEYGSELTDYMRHPDGPLSAAGSGKRGREAGVTGEESPTGSLYDLVLSLRSQIDAADATEELSRRRVVHRNFSLFIPAPDTPSKTSADGRVLGLSNERSRL